MAYMVESTKQAQRRGKMQIFAYVHYIPVLCLGFIGPLFSMIKAAVTAKLSFGGVLLASLEGLGTLLFLLVPTLLLFGAYLLNAFDRGKVGALFAALALIWNLIIRVDVTDVQNLYEFAFNKGNLVPGIDFSNMTNIWRFVFEFGLPFLVLAYSVSDGKGRESVAWLLIAMFLCGINIAINMAGGISTINLALTGAHFWMFASFIKQPVHRLTCVFMEHGKGKLEKTEVATFGGCVGDKVRALATILSVGSMCVVFILSVMNMCRVNFAGTKLLYSMLFMAGGFFASWVAGLVMYTIGKTSSNVAMLIANQQK